MPDLGRWGATGGDPSLNEINRTDQFLDALATQQQVYATDHGEAELASLLAGWRDDVRETPVTALVTPEEAGGPDGIEIELTLNGEQMQSDTTANFIFGVPRLVSYLSGLMTLEPGDIVATGTPDGVGGAREPRVWLGDGDELVVSSPTLGRLTTKIAR